MLFLAPVLISATALPPERTLGARPAGGRLGDAPRPRASPAALVSGRDPGRSPSSTSPGSGPRSSSARPSPASMPGGSPRRRASSPRRSPPPSSCWRANSICRSSTGLPPPRRTSSARRSPRSRSSRRSSTTRCRRTGPIAEDLKLLREQVERCRTILSKLTSHGAGPVGLPRDDFAEPPRRGDRRAAARRSASPIEVSSRWARAANRSGGAIPAWSTACQHRRQRCDFADETVTIAASLDRRRGPARDQRRRAGLCRRGAVAGRRALCDDAKRREAAMRTTRAARASGSDCSSPRRCSNARAPSLSLSNAAPPGHGAVARIVWPRHAFERGGAADPAAGAPRGRP